MTGGLISSTIAGLILNQVSSMQIYIVVFNFVFALNCIKRVIYTHAQNLLEEMPTASGPLGQQTIYSFSYRQSILSCCAAAAGVGDSSVV